jgi:hypothetical protein
MVFFGYCEPAHRGVIYRHAMVDGTALQKDFVGGV